MKLPDGTRLDVSLEFGAHDTVPVGRLGLAERRAAFEQKRSFLDTGLSLHPLFPAISEQALFAPEPRLFDGLHGVFGDSLPDAWGRELLRRRAASEGISYNSLTPLDRLALIGTTGAGALAYRPALPETDLVDVDLDRLAESALSIVAGRETAALDALVRLGGSSGGARPKISVAMNAGGDLRPMTESLPDGYEAWIIKFRSQRDPIDAGPLEAAYADMARAAGLNVSETRLLPSTDGPGYFATKRFDRTKGFRLHMVSAAAMLEADWTLPGDYETLFKLGRRVTRDQREVEALFRRAVFNVVAHNRDDHWKQHAFLLDREGRWSVAPSFDLTNSPGPGGEHYLAIGGRATHTALDAFVRVGATEAIEPDRVKTIVAETIHAVGRFSEFAKNYGVSAASTRTVTTSISSAMNEHDSPRSRKTRQTGR